MFRRIRRRLTLWYGAVLAVALLLFGVALYSGEQKSLFDPLDTSLHQNVQTVAARCLQPFSEPHDAVDLELRDTPFWACYSPGGVLVSQSPLAELSPSFTGGSIVSSAVQRGYAEDTIDGGGSFGSIKRYAVSVIGATGAPVVVVMTGVQVGSQLDALHKLLILLLGLGLITLGVASFGGLFLAERALAPARLAQRRQQNFIADASHELRTPLTLLRADAEVLLRNRDRLAPDDAALLEDVVTEAAHMGSLADNMLRLARLDTGGLPIERDIVDLSVLAAEMARREGPHAAELDVTVRTEAEHPVLVVGDPLLLSQAALILVDNAIKYNRPGGQVTIRALQQGDQACFEVVDTGIGIAPEHLPHLGERFYRVDKARSREAGGLGLGVSIARGIAARHGGSLRFTSEPERGTTAVLCLPLAAERQPARGNEGALRRVAD